MLQLLGYLLFGFALADFFAGNFANINLTPFMGQLSGLSPIIFGAIGAILINTGEKNLSDLFEGQDEESELENLKEAIEDHKRRTKSRKKKRRRKK
tara:strand:+ start:114 stop:401 length:288 start_codon:yes stop_codon:yes gene_type:complete